MSTPNMGLTQSTPLVTGGPAWAAGIEANLLLIDQHDHTSGKGLPITQAAINITDDFDFGGFAGISLLSTKYESQSSSFSSSEQNAVYVVNGNLYYNNGTGTAVQITSGSSLNVSGVGGITGMSGTTAALTYAVGSTVFIFTQDAGITADIDAGAITLRQNVAAAHGIRVKSPNSLAGDYDVTLFAALPAARKIVRLTAGGQLEDALDVDNSTLEIVSDVLRIKDSGVVVAKLANDAVETAKIKDLNVTVAKLADDAVETVKIKNANVTVPKLAATSVQTSATINATGTGAAATSFGTVVITPEVSNRPVVLTTGTSCQRQ
jgi:hypothetical protein